MLENINQWLFLLINNFAGKNGILDKIGVLFGEKGPYIFIILIIYIYFVKKNKKEAIYATITVILAIVLNHIVELFYFHPRPFMDGLGVVLKEHKPDSSFPSDHTTFMLAISWALIMFKNTKTWGKTMLIIGIVFGICRVFEGIHYPFDILGALVMGYISSLIIYNLQDKLNFIIDIIIKIDNKIFKKS